MTMNNQNPYSWQSKQDFLQTIATQNLKEFQLEIDDYQLDRFRKLSSIKKYGFFSSPVLSFWVSGDEYSNVKVADKIHVDNHSFAVKSVILFKDHDLFLANARHYLRSEQLPLAQAWVVRKEMAPSDNKTIAIIRAFSTSKPFYWSLLTSSLKWAFWAIVVVIVLVMLSR